MLHLSTNNTLLEATLLELQQAFAQGAPLVVDRIVSDFDHTTFHLITPEDDTERKWVHLSIVTKAWPSLMQAGDNLLGFIQDKYARFPNGSIELLGQGQTTPGYDMTLRCDISQFSNDSTHELSLLKTHIMSYPFELAFAEWNELSKNVIEEQIITGQSRKIQYRDDENIYVQPSSDRITVIFETIFKDETDKIFGKVFLQEFVDARKRNRSIQSAPQVLYSTAPPREIAGSIGPNTNEESRFITFVLFPRHFKDAECQFKTVAQLLQFRNYFHYHIKCSKAFMHSRMRFRVNTFIKVLNRAKFDKDEEEEKTNDTQRRTITGRKMVY